MILYLAMWARGAAGNQVTRQVMQENKLYAKNVAERLRQATDTFHEIICPHEDPILDKIDDLWLDTRDERLVPIAIQRCYDLLDSCQGIVVFHRGHLSEGMQYEIERVRQKGMFIYEAEDCTEETIEDLIHAIYEWEEMHDSRLQQ